VVTGADEVWKPRRWGTLDKDSADNPLKKNQEGITQTQTTALEGGMGGERRLRNSPGKGEAWRGGGQTRKAIWGSKLGNVGGGKSAEPAKGVGKKSGRRVGSSTDGSIGRKGARGAGKKEWDSALPYKGGK